MVVDSVDTVDSSDLIDREYAVAGLLRVRPEETIVPAVPKYARVAQAIRDQISTGALQPGDRLPTTEQLIELYDVGYGTLRTALLLLEAEGLIEGRPGDGRYVKG